VEIIGYHATDRTIKILLALIVENMAENGVKNDLRLMHAGTPDCFVVPPWPLPKHPDEEPDSKGILDQLFGHAFESGSGGLKRTKGLTSWDECHPIPETPIVTFQSGGDHNPLLGGSFVMPEQGIPTDGRVAPFTVWKFGPFTQKAAHLITLGLRFAGSSCDQLLGPGQVEFTVDGPLRLVTRIKLEDLSDFSSETRRAWVDRITPFEEANHLLMGEGYDVIILREPLADRVELVGEIGIARAAKQPVQRGVQIADRFVTTHRHFSILARLAERTAEELVS